MKTINILFGTVYGSAQFVAETLTTELQEQGYQTNLLNPEENVDFVPSEDELLLVITSTTGQGDLPDNILPWFESMRSAAPYLPKLKYGLIGLGDSSYETYCGAIKQVDALLEELGANAIVPRLEVDAIETMEPEVEAKAWVKGFITAIG
ncbi:flavodoxin [Parashewanella curva]|uniref:Flavodoxin n=1 Tax=Parashewanella curva TaxID=2338552 RepID=A0A3L8PWM8_9GAMM|nr:flavodoxin [Parashewanella curva]RLV58848.1 flavodoxin [Parashewanella curva]